MHRAQSEGRTTEESGAGVKLWREVVVIPTYPLPPPDPNPMFLEKRVYQGSSGKVYPLPFTDRVSDEKVDREYDAIFLENEYIRLMILPEIGGRIHVGRDKTNGYDFFYHNRVIKPALVGLLGPWISGGVEFNWPQHHRPTTFQPVDNRLVENPDGSKTAWLGEIEPMTRTKGMVGITLHPGSSRIEAKVRLYNRTPLPQTFLWWANVAVHVHDRYQSFFPPDVTFVADHAKRAVIGFPVARGRYYGVDYSPGTRIDWYKNIPVPTSYMVTHSEYDFFGGYDHAKEAGFVHVADRHIAPGKKQWTWGNAEFGYAWDRNLTDEDGPYIELMAGVYTDNQPDFSWLQPYETKAFSQVWYPIREIGPAKNANREAALNLEAGDECINVGCSVSSVQKGCTMRLAAGPEVLLEEVIDLDPATPVVREIPRPANTLDAELSLRLLAADGPEIVGYRPVADEPAELPEPAKPIPPPADVPTVEDLYLCGLHLEQYRHATRDAEAYYREALRREPGHARSNNALGLLLLRRGLFAEAVERFEMAIATLTRWNPNPYDGEPFYNLGLARTFLGQHDRAYGAFAKATWNQAWSSAGYYALAELDCRRGNWGSALEHLERSLATDTLNNRASNLEAAVLRKLGRREEAEAVATGVRERDVLDYRCRNELSLVRDLLGREAEAERERQELAAVMRGQAQSYLELAIEYADAGLHEEAVSVLSRFVAVISDGPVYPLIYYYLGFYSERLDEPEAVSRYYRLAAEMVPDYCFPSRLESIGVLERAIERDPADAKAHYYLGNLLYDKRRYEEAIRHWEAARSLDGSFSIVHRNLGFAYYNIRRDDASAEASLERAVAVNPRDARLLFELDQLRKKVGRPPAGRLADLERGRGLVDARDDLYLEYVTLHNLTGQPDEALRLLAARTFHPWEGGEGKVTEQYVLARLARGCSLLAAGEPGRALGEFAAARTYPRNLGEGKHLGTPEAHIFYLTGAAHGALGEAPEAAAWYRRAVEEENDWSAMSYFQGLAHRLLGQEGAAEATFRGLIEYAEKQLTTPVDIPYFATSLPSFLLFEDDLNERNRVHCHYLLGLGRLGVGEVEAAQGEFRTVRERDPNHVGVALVAGLSSGAT